MRGPIAVVLALAMAPALALSPEAQEFLEVAKRLEPVHCERQKLRREIALADAERDAARGKLLRERFDALGRDRETARLDRRLAELEPRIIDREGKPRRAEDLDAISLQRRAAFYRCN